MEARASEQQTRKESENSLQTKFMEEEGEKSPVPALSVLQRLDHLDHLVTGTDIVSIFLPF